MIETDQLRLIPLTHEQLLLYIKNDGSLESALGLNPTEREISPRLAEAFEKRILPAIADSSKDYLYATFWSVILKEENKMVADLCFKGEPNENGEVEIGYGTYPAFRGKGYMTEALLGLISWAIQQDDITAIIAQTNPDNIASIKVLENNGFVKEKEEAGNIWWALEF